MATNTPNMGLTKPGVNTEPGPDWATQLNSSLDTLDVHDHSSGKGIKITPTGLNINSDLDIQDNDLLNVNHIRLSNTTGSGIDGVYQNGGNLYWRNNAGVDVQITAGNTINVGSLGTIGGDYSTDPNNPLITFTTATGNYDFFKDTIGSPIAGGINCGDLTIFEEAAGTNGISIISPSSLAAAYTITLPSAQAASNNSLISVSAAGAWNYTRDPTVDTIGFGAGTVSAPSFYRESDSQTGRYFPAVSQIADTLGGVQSWLQTQSTHTLNVSNASDFISLISRNNGASVNSFQLENSVGSADHIRLKNNNGRMYFELDNTNEFYRFYSGADIIYQSDYTEHQFFVNRTDGERVALSLANSGSSVSSLQIENSIGSADNIRIKNNNGRMYYELDNASEFYEWYIAGTAYARISSTATILDHNLVSGNNVILSAQNTGSSVSSFQLENSLGSADNIRIKNNNGRMYYELDNTGEFFQWYIGATPYMTLGNTGILTTTDISSPTATITTLGSTTINVGTLNATSIPTVNSTTVNATTGNITTVNATTVSATGVGQFTGGIQAGNVSVPILKWKSLSPPFAGTPGNNGSIAHGLSPGNIRDVSISGTDASSNVYISCGSNGGGDIEITSISSTTIFFTHNVAALNSRTARVLIAYV